jgi:hypothetical protein
MAITTKTISLPQVTTARLVVLVPEQVENLADFARHIYMLALAQQRNVVYLALIRCGAEDLSAMRTQATLLALTQGSQVQASMIQVKAEHWAEALRLVAQPGDWVICSDGQGLAANGSHPFGALEAELHITVQSLPGIFSASPVQPSSWKRIALCWISGMVVLVGFSFLELHLAGHISGTLKKVVLVALTALEIGTFYQWDKIFS